MNERAEPANCYSLKKEKPGCKPGKIGEFYPGRVFSESKLSRFWTRPQAKKGKSHLSSSMIGPLIMALPFDYRRGVHAPIGSHRSGHIFRLG